MAELGLVKEVPPTHGSKDLGILTISRKSLWINLNCVGDGTVKVTFGPPSNTMNIPCKSDVLTPTRNQIDIPLPESLPLRVDAPPNVEWSLRIQQ
jgi:hypothetical protein